MQGPPPSLEHETERPTCHHRQRVSFAHHPSLPTTTRGPSLTWMWGRGALLPTATHRSIPPALHRSNTRWRRFVAHHQPPLISSPPPLREREMEGLYCPPQPSVWYSQPLPHPKWETEGLFFGHNPIRSTPMTLHFPPPPSLSFFGCLLLLKCEMEGFYPHHHHNPSFARRDFLSTTSRSKFCSL